MSAISLKNTDNDIRLIFEHLFKDETLNPGSLLSEDYIPAFEFRWGERVTKCERGKPIVTATNDGQNDTTVDIQSKLRSYFIRMQVVSGGDDESSQSLFYRMSSLIKSNFSASRINHKFSEPYQYKDPEGIEHTVNAPFRLGALGVENVEIASTSPVIRLDNDSCKALYLEILVRLQFYLSIR